MHVNTAANQQLREYEVLSKDIAGFRDQLKEIVGLLQPLKSWWFDATSILEELEERLLNSRTAQLKVIDNDAEMTRIETFWLRSRTRFQSFIPLVRPATVFTCILADLESTIDQIEKLMGEAPASETLGSDVSQLLALLTRALPNPKLRSYQNSEAHSKSSKTHYQSYIAVNPSTAQTSKTS